MTHDRRTQDQDPPPQEEIVGRVIDALVDLGAPYMIAGSFASNVHGVPRMTNDANVVVDLDELAAARLVRLLQAEFYVSADAAQEAVRQRRMFHAIHLQTGFKVDLVVKKRRAFSDEELRRRQPAALAGRRADFATAEDTILAKLEWAQLGESERQYGDVLGLILVQGERLDWSYLERWAAELGVQPLLERARRHEPFR